MIKINAYIPLDKCKNWRPFILTSPLNLTCNYPFGYNHQNKKKKAKKAKKKSKVIVTIQQLLIDLINASRVCCFDFLYFISSRLMIKINFGKIKNTLKNLHLYQYICCTNSRSRDYTTNSRSRDYTSYKERCIYTSEIYTFTVSIHQVVWNFKWRIVKLM